jgi:prolyl-tRNA editing enzyme YbaK/EbsC (Cys-tRNA(Pro) deacylase)
MPSTTRTAKEAADSIGCSVSQIAKSLVFRVRSDQRPLLVIASGGHRVDEARIAAAIGNAVDAQYVRERTGFSIGGIPPVGHREPLQVLLDETLKDQEILWAAAGTPFAVFPVTPSELQSMTHGTWIPLA